VTCSALKSPYHTTEPDTVPGALNMQKVIDKLCMNGQSSGGLTPHSTSHAKLVIDLNPKTTPQKGSTLKQIGTENRDIIHASPSPI